MWKVDLRYFVLKWGLDFVVLGEEVVRVIVVDGCYK